MRIEFHAGVHQAGGYLLRHNILGDTHSLRRNGVICVNSFFPDLLRAQARILRQMDSRVDPRLVEVEKLRGLNEAMLEKAAEFNPHTIVILQEDRLGYPPYAHFSTASGKVGFYDRAHLIMRRLLAGFDLEKTTLHLYSRRLETLIPRLWLDGLQHQLIECTLDDFTARMDQDRFLFSHLIQRMQHALPGLQVTHRSYELIESDPAAFVARFYRDIGLDPDSKKIETHFEEHAIDRGQMTELISIAQADKTDPSRKKTYRAAAQKVFDRGANQDDLVVLSDPQRAKLRAISDLDEGLLANLQGALPVSAFFMVEPGPLELQAHLLIASLRLYCEDPLELVGFCRDDRIDRLHPDTVAFLKANQVTLKAIKNNFEDGYPAGNKLIAAHDVRPEGWAVFLDTDMVMVRPSSFLAETTAGRVSVCLDTLNAWSRRAQDWRTLYQTFDQDLPPFKMRLAQGQLSYPLYNAGFVMFPPARRSEEHFGQFWHDCALALEANPDVIKKRPWLDTIALAIAPNLSQTLGVRLLDKAWNCTTRLADEQTRILHYHGIRQLKIHNWQAKVDKILAVSPSPFNSLDEALHYHAQEMQIEGDLDRRAMRHGLNITES